MNTEEVAKRAGVHKDTLLRWLRAGLVPEPGRDGRGWRVFTAHDAESVATFARWRSEVTEPEGAYSVAERYAASSVAEPHAAYSTTPQAHPAVESLRRINWDFSDASTGYLTHGLHPYPAKFIPQIPNALIQELSSVGETVLDPFAGSGTTLVEALILKRHVIGIDANPIACLIARAKTGRLNESDVEELRMLEMRLPGVRTEFISGQKSLFELSEPSVPTANPDIDFWFDAHVIPELWRLKELCEALHSNEARELAKACFSSIIVNVSKQDSDTRYVRRSKLIEPGDTVRRFERALATAIPRAVEFSDLAEPRFRCDVLNRDVLEAPNITPVDLVVSSPPYPNAFSYHLYHRTRMLWLGMDSAEFKKREIGSHRKYSSRAAGAAGPETFEQEMATVFGWLNRVLKPGGFCCFVIGDSTIRGASVRNDQIIRHAGAKHGFRLEAQLERQLQDTRKSFNPSIGRIKEEHILILRNGS